MENYSLDNITYAYVDIEIQTPNQIVTESIQLDKTVTHVLAIGIEGDRDDLMYHQGRQSIEINRRQYFPERYRSKFFMSGVNTPPNEKFYDVGKLNAGNGIVKVTYTDKPSSLVFFSPYMVSYVFVCLTKSLDNIS